MLERLLDELYGSTEAVFDVAGSPENGARRLAEATPRTALSTLTREAIVGSVSVDRVVLRRYRPFVNNSFAPIYRGRFEVRAGRTRLCGRFRLHVFVQVFMSVWFGFLLLVVPFALLGGISRAIESGSPWSAGLTAALTAVGPAFLMGVAGFGFVRFGKWVAREDGTRIERHIRRALESPAT